MEHLNKPLETVKIFHNILNDKGYLIFDFIIPVDVYDTQQAKDERDAVLDFIIDKFDIIVATQDWHPKDHVSFALSHEGKNIYDQIDINGIIQTLWPAHCVQGTEGADLHKDLNMERINLILRKGMHTAIDSYSAFTENDQETITGLHGFLNTMDVSEIFICGLATDVCVYYTAMDGVKYGFKTTVLTDASRGIDNPAGSLENILDDMRDKGINVIDTNRL